MKRTFFILCILTTSLVAQAVSEIHSAPITTVPPAFSWNMTVHDFGKIPLSKPVTHEFRFKNSGNAPLIISSVQASCGCTVTDYSKDPIAPGAEGFVKATYDAAKAGVFTKTVTVNANSEESVVRLMIKGEVK